MMPHADPLHKVTIIPRGMALGLTMQLPLDDKHCYSKDYLMAQLAILMGGRIAEEMFMNHITTGAGNDIERATDLARKMVCEWGMSELGPMSFGKKEEQIFLGREIAQHRDYSESTAIEIDQQVRKLVDGGYQEARKIIADTPGSDEAHCRGIARTGSSGWRRSESADRWTTAAAIDRLKELRTIPKGIRFIGLMAEFVCLVWKAGVRSLRDSGVPGLPF